MLRKSAILASVGLALLTGCNPMAERRYVNEGAGVDLYSANSEEQAVLLDAYTTYLCRQMGEPCMPGSMTFVIAGMNDIDQRCDGYLTWLDGKRRDREPILAQIAAVGAAVHAVMTVTGSSPTSLEILSSAFGLASATYSNWNSRLLISANQSTVQEVVYTGQGDYRLKIKDWPVTDRPTAIYLLRNYLRLCMPTTIEASINTSTTLVQRGASANAMRNLVVTNTTQVRPAIIRDINAPLRRFEPGSVTPRPPPSPTTQLSDFEKNMMRNMPRDMRLVLDTLCRPPSERDLGPAGSPARKALAKFLKDNAVASVEVLNTNAFINIQDLSDAGKKAC